MTSELIAFDHLRCHSSSTALGNRTMVTESQLREVQMKPPLENGYFNENYKMNCLNMLYF